MKRFLRRSAIVLAVLLPVLVGALTLWYRENYTLPPLAPVVVTLPRPNAYDTLRAARQRLVGEQGGILLWQDKPQPLAGRQKLLAANADALAKIREALAQEYVIPDHKNHWPGAGADSRQLARLLTFAAQTEADSGNPAAAIGYALDTIALGVMLPRGGGMISGLTGIACEASGVAMATALIPRLDAPTARAAAQRVATIEARRWPYQEHLRVEKRELDSNIRLLYSGTPRAIWENLGAFLDPTDEKTTLRERAEVFQERITAAYLGPKRVQASADRWMAAVIRRSEQPWGTPPVPEPSDPVNQRMIFLQTQQPWVQAEAKLAALKARLTLRATPQAPRRTVGANGKDDGGAGDELR